MNMSDNPLLNLGLYVLLTNKKKTKEVIIDLAIKARKLEDENKRLQLELDMARLKLEHQKRMYGLLTELTVSPNNAE